MDGQKFLEYKNWVVIGDVLNSEKYAHRILNSLKEHDFNAVGMHPSSQDPSVYKSLKDVPYSIDVIDLCINPIQGEKVLIEAKELEIDKVLIQPGAQSEEILSFCRENGIIAIEGCALVELSYYNRKR